MLMRGGGGAQRVSTLYKGGGGGSEKLNPVLGGGAITCGVGGGYKLRTCDFPIL